ncbi:MAG: flavodoxin family protein [Lachnospiraceae bacterium]|nr:flavodoxin family protein [Lachnospiraceae bacterium]
MKYGIIFVSKTGNTEKLAKAIYESIPDNSKDIQRLTEESEYDLADTVFVGFWTDHGTCSMEVLNYLSELHDKNIVLFGTCGMGADEAYYRRIEKQVNVWISDDNNYLGIFMCQGKMPMNIRNKYEAILEQGNQDDKALKMIRNFDEALLHPNQEDYEKADAFVNKIINKLADY